MGLVPTDDELRVMYGDGYFGADGDWVCGFWDGGYIDNEQNVRQEARLVLAELGAPAAGHTRLLEIGAAGGFFLDEARRVGYDVVGIELNASMATFGRDHLGLDMRSELFETAVLDARFDVIVAQDVLEHVRGLRFFVRRVAGLLRSGGVFFVRGPLEQSARETIYLALRKYVRRDVLVRREPPYHLQGFCRRSFAAMLGDAGLVITAFRATSLRPVRHWRTPKQAAATTVELVAHLVVIVSGGGEFMTASATGRAAAAPAPRETASVSGTIVR